jgi:hypothetical protein
MTTYSRHPAFLSLQGGINFRDLGGLHTADGRRVRAGETPALRRVTSDDRRGSEPSGQSAGDPGH